MKRLLTIALALFTMGLLHGEQFDAKTWNAVQTYDLPKLKQIEMSQIGKIVAIRFNYRDDNLREEKSGWYEGMIRRYSPNRRDLFSHLRVAVPPAGLDWFQTIATNFRTQHTRVVYGEVMKDDRSGQAFVRLIGRNVTRDLSGNTTVGW